MKVADFENTSYPNGMPKKINAHMKIRRNGEEFDEILGYNNPILLNQGTKEVLLRTYGNVPNAIVLNIDGKLVDLRANEVIEINESKTLVSDLYLPPRVRLPVVRLISEDKDTKEYNQTYIPIGNQNTQTVNGAEVTFEDLKTSTAVVVSVKENPSIPLTFVAIGCFGSGMLLVIFRTAYKMVRI